MAYKIAALSRQFSEGDTVLAVVGGVGALPSLELCQWFRSTLKASEPCLLKMNLLVTSMRLRAALWMPR